MAIIHSFKAGSRVPNEIVKVVKKEKIQTALVGGIGGVRNLTLAYFNHRTKKYEQHDFDEFLEVTSLLGNITVKDGEPFLHAHGTFGRRDLSVIGGHIISATAFPFLELVITPTKNKAFRVFDEKSGLNVIGKTQG